MGWFRRCAQCGKRIRRRVGFDVICDGLDERYRFEGVRVCSMQCGLDLVKARAAFIDAVTDSP